jgi:hypothetical protein
MIRICALLLILPSTLFGQLRFEVPVRVHCGSVTDTIHFGIAPGADFCIKGDSIDGIYEIGVPPLPPQGILDARFVCPRVPFDLECFDQGAWSDFRPYLDSTQRDTFRIRLQSDGVNPLVLSWPSSLTRYFSSLRMGNIDMLTATDAQLDDGTYWIYAVAVGDTAGGFTPQGFELFQNFPNPFNGVTHITFNVRSARRVSLKVYDVTGRQVAVLVDGIKPARQFTTQWDAGAFSSGVYILRMTAGSFSQERKLLLVK